MAGGAFMTACDAPGVWARAGSEPTNAKSTQQDEDIQSPKWDHRGGMDARQCNGTPESKLDIFQYIPNYYSLFLKL